MAAVQSSIEWLAHLYRGMGLYTTFQILKNSPVASGLVPRWAA